MGSSLSSNSSTKKPKVLRKPKTCTCCGNYAGRWIQWWNQDDGMGICMRCIEWMLEEGEEDEIYIIRELYGNEGVHYGSIDEITGSPGNC